MTTVLNVDSQYIALQRSRSNDQEANNLLSISSHAAVKENEVNTFSSTLPLRMGFDQRVRAYRVKCIQHSSWYSITWFFSSRLAIFFTDIDQGPRSRSSPSLPTVLLPPAPSEPARSSSYHPTSSSYGVHISGSDGTLNPKNSALTSGGFRLVHGRIERTG